MTYHGKVISRPDYHDENMKTIIEGKNKILSNAKILIGKIESLTEKKMNIVEKIKALKELEELKNEKIITVEQYDSLKSKLL